ncbi:MAG: hypothetical protein O2980_00590, partial [Actinomycetota bacterium]|nr:hypothetical protein [Actinomycetota bacterium]
VERLARVAFGGVELGDLRQGKWRFLNRPEIARLHAAVGSEVPVPAEEPDLEMGEAAELGGAA